MTPARTIVVLGGDLAPAGRAAAEARAVAVIATEPYPTPEVVVATLGEHRPAAIVVRLVAEQLGEPVMRAGGALGLIVKHGVGTDDIDIEAARRLGIPVAITAGVNATSVAEHAFAGMLAFAKDLVGQDRLVRSGVWDKARYHGREVSGQTLGVVGFGAIGRKLAGYAQAFGMRVLAHDPLASAPMHGVDMADLDTLLAASDYVSLHCPLTPATLNLIDRRRIGLMRSHAVLINTARGGVVDEAALIDALRAGRLAGAVADCFAAEPPAADNPLLELPNTLVSPHIAGVTIDAKAAVSVCAATLAADWLDGRKPDPYYLVR